MPRISKYYGIAIYMYYQDHAPPHFHAIYGEHEALFDIATAKVIEGELPNRDEAGQGMGKVAPERTPRELGASAGRRDVAAG